MPARPVIFVPGREVRVHRSTVTRGVARLVSLPSASLARATEALGADLRSLRTNSAPWTASIRPGLQPSDPGVHFRDGGLDGGKTI